MFKLFEKKEKPKNHRSLTARIAVTVVALLLLMQIAMVVFMAYFCFTMFSAQTSFAQEGVVTCILDRIDPDAIDRSLSSGEKDAEFLEMERTVDTMLEYFEDFIGSAILLKRDGDVYRVVMYKESSNPAYDREETSLLTDEFGGVSVRVTPEVVGKILALEKDTRFEEFDIYVIDEALSPFPKLKAIIDTTSLWMVDVSAPDQEPGSLVLFLQMGLGSMIILSLLFLIVYGFVVLVATIILCIRLVVRLRKGVSLPVIQIKTATEDFMKQTEEVENPKDWEYKAPDIKTRDEINALADSIVDMTTEIKKAVSERMEITKKQEKIKAELDLASGIQSGALPTDFPDDKRFLLHASMSPAKEVGGDFYNFFFLDEDRLALLIADVSGKGVPGALFMMYSKNLIDSLFQQGLSPQEILIKANETMTSGNGEDMFVTVWAAIINVNTGELVAANAGHEYPAIRRADGRFEFFEDDHGFVIGELPGMTYREYELKLQPGDTIFVYTDGVPEANDPKENMFGMDRLLEVLNEDPDAAPKELTVRMQNALHAFMDGIDPFDDVTMLCLKMQ